ncbi:hypothetical protein [Spongiactinospora sp. TRM90649]|nr:hypothetical protein [Spongiactinospora sp. TRM90649]MDF5751351.1 hypothetical protein [Spongiactinospora sp. TRM90649]
MGEHEGKPREDKPLPKPPAGHPDGAAPSGKHEGKPKDEKK